MRKTTIIACALFMGILLLFCAGSGYTQTFSRDKSSYEVVKLDTITVTASISTDSYKYSSGRESIFPDIHRPLGIFSHFTWGVDLGASIDMSGTDMSTFDADVFLGYKNSWIRSVGAGVGIHQAFGNGHNLIPVYALFRSSFRKKPSLFFFDMRAGYSFNHINNTDRQGGAFGSVGVGINLAMSKHFQSHIILSYGYYVTKAVSDLTAGFDASHINYAQIRIGANF